MRRELTSGSVLAGRYEIIEELGKGGMGQVYVALDSRLNRKVALKVLPAQMLESEQSIKRFEREAKAVAALSHPHIMAIHDFGEDEGIVFAVMELLEGETLRTRLMENPLPPSVVLNYAEQITAGVAYAHEQGVIHRDLKPENIFITKEGRIKILDFGLAKVQISELENQEAAATITQSTEPGMVMGTLGYMSPEQVRGKEIDHRSDVFSLGAVLYEMLSGRRAFKGESPADTMSAILKEDPPELTQLVQNLPPALESIIKRCLAKSREERFQSARDLKFALESISGEKAAFQFTDTVEPGIKTGAQAEVLSTAESAGLFFRSWFSSPLRTILTAAVPLALAAVLFFLFRPTSLLGFAERDWVLIADYQHTEDQAELARALSLALKVGIEESNYVNVISKSRRDSILKLMQKPRDTLIDQEIGREMCVRARIKGLIVPELSRVGDQYLLALSLISPVSGDSVASFAERAEKAEDLLDRLDSLIQDLRKGLGESFDSLQQGKPLPAAATGSLEALLKYSSGRSTWNSGKYNEALEFYEEALKIDPDFAMVYAALGNAYGSYMFRDMEKAESNFQEALKRLDRVGPREEFFIQALYHGSMRRYEESIRFYALHLERYPDDIDAHFNTGNMYRNLRNMEMAFASYEEALRLNPLHASALINSAGCLSSQHKTTEAIGFYKRAFEVNPNWEIQGNLNHEYGITLMEADLLEEARAVFEKRTAHSNANERGNGFRSLGQLALYRGRFDEAAEHFGQAALLHEAHKASASVARDRLWWAIGETARGENAEARRLLSISQDLVPLTGGWIWMHSLLGRALVAAGGIDEAAAIDSKIKAWSVENENWNSDALQRHVLLEIDLEAAQGGEGSALERMESLQAVQTIDNPFLTEALASTYFKLGRWEDSVEKFTKLIDLRWMSYEGLIPWVLAHYKLAVAYEWTGDAAKAAEYYRKFLDRWKDADPGISEVEDARKRLEALGNSENI
jgi:tetratricopeptide (TPR) repeat protein